ncbi:MAG: ribonuclease P protein component [Oscillospiraceae bacterium]|jgi:ribonuclease P protein component|nr:ribonuclease P protein component [Oscillospiraceae bacterium]
MQNYEFRRVYSKGRSAATSRLVLYALRNFKGDTRFGISVSAKIGNAVARNKIRRRCKEFFRTSPESFKASYDYIAVARLPAAAAEYRELSRDLTYLADKLAKLPPKTAKPKL